METSPEAEPRENNLYRSLQDGPALDRASEVPLWIQTRNLLEQAIHHPGVQPNARLPSEHTLCRIFDVSRPVVRLALDALAGQGLISKLPRQGVFVSPRKMAVDFVSLNVGLFGEMISKGHQVTTRVLEVRRASPTAEEQQHLRLPGKGTVVRIHRVYSVDGHPTAVSMLVLAGHKVPGIEEQIGDNISVYGILRARYGLTVVASERWFEAGRLSAPEAKLLGSTPNKPAILIESVGALADGTPLEYFRTTYSTEHTRIRVTALTRADGGTP